MNLPRCPYCSLLTALPSGESPPRAGSWVVCAGCTMTSRFSEDCGRLCRVDLKHLTEKTVSMIRAVQETVRERLGPTGLPPGHSYREGMLCRPCWQEFEPGVEPAALSESEWENCAFCERLTNSGIYRRMLLPHRRLPPIRGVLS